MRNRRVRAVLTAVCVLVVGCSDGSSSELVSGPANSIDGQLPNLIPGEELPGGEAHAFVVGTHCGVTVLGLLINGTNWITDEATQSTDWMPPEWAEAIEGGQELIALSIVLSDDGSELVATADRVSVKYRPATADDQIPDCA